MLLLYLVSFILLLLFIYLIVSIVIDICDNLSHNKTSTTINTKLLFTHLIIIIISGIFLASVIIISLFVKHHIIMWSHYLLIAYGQNTIIEFVDSLYFYLRHIFKKLRLFEVIIGIFVFLIVIFLIGVMFKELFNEYVISAPYKFAGAVVAVYTIIYDIVHYYSNYYMYESTTDDGPDNKKNKEKQFTLKLYELVVANISVLYTIITFIWIEVISYNSKMNIQNYQIHWSNFISSNTLALSDIALELLTISITIIALVTLLIKYCIKKYYGYGKSDD